jgi:tetratricopeptide (TPR) repeat protein
MEVDMKRLFVILLLGALLVTSCARNRFKEVEVKHETTRDYMSISVDGIYEEANTLYQKGEYQEAAAKYLEGLKHDVQNSNAMYNLACCYGLAGDGANAVKYLEHAIRFPTKLWLIIHNWN